MSEVPRRPRTRLRTSNQKTLVLILKMLVVLMSAYGAMTLDQSQIGSGERVTPLDVGAECKRVPHWSEPEIDWLDQRGIAPSRAGLRHRVTGPEFCWL